jgi:hypothetical protein
MARTTVVEHLQQENRMLREQIERMRRDPPDVPFHACDNSCVVARPNGMATNGGCRCDERTLRRAVQWWRGKARHLQSTIDLMRDGDMIAQFDERTAKEEGG